MIYYLGYYSLRSRTEEVEREGSKCFPLDLRRKKGQDPPLTYSANPSLSLSQEWGVKWGECDGGGWVRLGLGLVSASIFVVSLV